MKFVIFHGSFGAPESHWFPELKERLESLNQEVVIPRFPTEDWEEVTKAGPQKPPKNQSLISWLKAFEKIAGTLKKDEKPCFISHSLGCLFSLHLVDKYSLQLDSAIFVSPFLEKLGRSWQIDLVNKSFYKTDFDFVKLQKLIPISYVLYSDNDPYVASKYPVGFAQKLGSSLIFVRKAGHMNIEFGFKTFPLVFELCKTRLDPSVIRG
jgi:predicted alpha/beta hydrolase family esterase